VEERVRVAAVTTMISIMATRRRRIRRRGVAEGERHGVWGHRSWDGVGNTITL